MQRNVENIVSRTGQEIHLKQYPKEMPTEDIFELAKVDVPKPKDGEFLVRNVWMSVDPYMRGRMRSPQETKSYISSFQLNKPLDGACMGQIIESKNKDFTVEEYVLGTFVGGNIWLSNGNDILKNQFKNCANTVVFKCIRYDWSYCICGTFQNR